VSEGGICDVSVNGATVCQGLDLHRASVTITNVFLGEHLLRDGTNEVTVRVTGCAAGLDPSQLSVGLDCVDIGSLYARIAATNSVSPMIGPLEDPDRDGLLNVFEYAFGGDPSKPDGGELWPSPLIMNMDGVAYPVVSYRRRQPTWRSTVVGEEGVSLQVDGVIYQVQESLQLCTDTYWTNIHAGGPALVAVGAPDDETNETLRVPAGAGSRAAPCSSDT